MKQKEKMSNNKVVYAKVMGSGEFPLDMLRYDSCCPATEKDSGVIRSTFKKVFRDNSLIFSYENSNEVNWAVFVKKVLLERRRKNESVFTVGRWVSFGCIIQEVDSPYGNRKVPEERITSSIAKLCTFNPVVS